MSDLDAPSQHPVPLATPEPSTWQLEVSGLVARPLTLSLKDLDALDDATHEGSFTCVRGWEAGLARWQGPLLSAVLAQAQVLPEADALYAYSPEFRSLVPLEAADQAILATRLDDQALNQARGAPCRLVVDHPDSQLSLKWLLKLELVKRAPDQEFGPRRPD